MAQVLFAGGKLNSFAPTGAVSEITTAGRFNNTYADSVIQTSNITAYVTGAFTDTTGASANITGTGTYYCHFDFFDASGVTDAGGIIFCLYDASTQPWLSIRCTGANGAAVYYNSGTGPSPVWTIIGSAFTVPYNSLATIDLKLVLNGAGTHSMELSVNQSIAASGTFSLTVPNLSKFRFMNPSPAARALNFSQVLITEGISTINAKVKYSSATAAGTNSGWTGAYTDINEAIGSDATVLSAASAGLKSTFAMGDVTVPVGFVIKDVFVWSRGKNDGASPANIKTVVRSGGTDYSSSDMTGVGTSFGPLLNRRNVDPATSTAWTQSGWNAVEVGVESAA